MVISFLDFNQTAMGNFAVNVDLTDLSAFNQTSSFGLNQMFVYVFLKYAWESAPAPASLWINAWIYDSVCVCVA